MRRRTGEALARIALAAALALVAAPARAGDEVSVRASVDRAEIAEDEVVVLTLRIEAEEAPSAIDLREGELPFEVRSRSDSRSTSLSVDGAGVKVRRATVVTLALAPTRAGDLEIPALGVTVKGTRHATAPIRVKVLPAAGPRAPAPPAPAPAPAPPPPPRGGAWRGWERDLVLEVEVDRREVFLGEQVTAAVWLLSPAGVAEYEGYRPPALDGFWVEELERPRQLGYRVRNVKGVPTRAYLLQRLALFPTRAGELEIGPYAVDVALRVGSPSVLSPLGTIARAHRRSAPVKLRAKPLPPGAPPGFQGVNVGAFELAAATAEAEVLAGQPVVLRVTASGEGNVRALALPRVPPLPGTRRFEPSVREEITARSGRLGGSRTLETVLVPERPGDLELPALAWAFFDPRAGRYVTARTEPLRVKVRAAPAAEAAPPPPDPLAALRPLREGGALSPRGGPPAWRSPLFVALVALPPLAFALLAGADAWRRRASASAPARRARGAGRRARRRLAAAAARLDARDRAGFLDETARALAGYAEDRLGRPVAALTREDLALALAEAGAPRPAADALARALAACDAARFGGGAVAEDVRALSEEALALLEAQAAPAREARP